MLCKVLIFFADGNLILEFRKKSSVSVKLRPFHKPISRQFSGLFRNSYKMRIKHFVSKSIQNFRDVQSLCSLLTFHQKKAPKICKLFHLKTLFVFEIIKLVIFLLLVQRFRILRGSWSAIIIMLRNGLHKLQIVIVGTTQKSS